MPPTLERDELIARITGVIAHTQKLPAETVTLDKTFADLNIDALDGINILFAVESEFDIEIPDDAANDIRSVRDMVDGIEKLLAAKAAPRQA
jgi:acyl carrier protein